MITVVNPYKASPRRLASLPLELSFNRSQSSCPNYTSIRHYYKIEYIRRSENAWLLFVCHMATQKPFVLKILCKYKDTRYNLETVSERQQCQLEALRWNRTFTSEVYLGLARICDIDLHRKTIVTDDIIENPTETFDPSSDYALIMRQLPLDCRLDLLFNKENIASLKHYIQLLTKRLTQIHQNIDPLPIEEARRWGDFQHLETKLKHNLALADPLLKAIEKGQYNSFNWQIAPLSFLKDSFFHVLPQVQHHRPYYQLNYQLMGRFNRLKDSLLQVFMSGLYQGYFEQRVQEKRVKHCHGDLKAPNILLAPFDLSCNGEPEKHVWILDAIDFNPMYCYIDVLSDLAMLVIDIQVRTRSSSLADLMVEYYLELTGQKDEVSRTVLAYYLVEKAFVGAAISYTYDGLPDLGWAYLQAAEMRMKDLPKQIG